MDKYHELEKQLAKIEARNQRVEKEKAWETSIVRRIAITVITYFSLAAYFGFVLKVNPWVNAIVPTVGFLLSTLSLTIVKNIWSSGRQDSKQL